MRVAIYMRVGTRKQLESVSGMEKKMGVDTACNMLGYPREAWMRLVSNNEMLRKLCSRK
ncbi:MAG: hypothetical protein IKI97_08355 [Clostridia bacterium]|nr:hypothetical protein [Clostridia bacterium]